MPFNYLKEDERFKTALKTGAAAFAVASALGSAPALAQDAQVDTASSDDEVEMILVTGSRILRDSNLEATSPVTTLDPIDAKIQGVTRIEDLMNSLPQAFAGQGNNLANGSSGTATLNLRGLGPSRTMVLINGRRLGIGDPFATSPDINLIPPAVIERVDVLTGGASSVYGSDAMAGVANFVMDTDFRGVAIDAQYGFFFHNNNNTLAQGINEGSGFDAPTDSSADGRQYDVTISFGGEIDDGRGQFMGYVGVRESQQVLGSARDYSNCVLFFVSAETQICGGSSNTHPTRFGVQDNDRIVNDEGEVLSDGPGESGNFILDASGPGNTVRPFDSQSDLFNYGQFTSLQRPSKRYVGGLFAEYEVNEHFRPYMEFMFMDDTSDSQIAPSASFTGNITTVACDNALLSDQMFELFCGQFGLTEDDIADVDLVHRNVEGSPRRNLLEHTDYRIVVGVEGEINQTWNYDAYIQRQVAIFNNRGNDLNRTKARNAVDAVEDENGNIVCRSVVNGTDPNCVVWNIFQIGGVTQEALDYIALTAFTDGQVDSSIASASITGDLGDYGFVMPWAEDGVGVAFGLEHRKEHLERFADDLSKDGLAMGSGSAAADVDGSFHVTEFFGETRIPVIQDSGMLEEFAIDGSFRLSDYNTSGTVNAWKIAGDMAFQGGFRLRGGFNRAVRAANVVELFRPRSRALSGNTDPCAGGFDDASMTTVNGFTFEQCARTGVTMAQFGNIEPNPANQYNGLLGGNPDLKPEVGDTFTVGAVATPDILPGFTASLDYFNIKIEDRIGTIGTDTILLTCVNDGNLCDLIIRDNQGSLWKAGLDEPRGFTINTTVNAGLLETSGVDVSVSYQRDTKIGHFSGNLVGTHVIDNIFDVASTRADCTGFHGPQCGVPTFDWRHKMQIFWDMPWWPMTTSLQWRFFSSSKTENASPDEDLAGGFNEFFNLPSVSYLDLSFNYSITDKIGLRIGANNVLDRDPPVVDDRALPSITGSLNTFPQVYDAGGRFVYFNTSIKFGGE